MSKLIIAKIEEGTVIDHIPQGQAMAIVHTLRLNEHPSPLMIATHLKSQKLGEKDLIKIASRFLTEDEILRVAILALGATLSSIRFGKVVEKITLARPKEVFGLWPCPNMRCIANREPQHSHFKISAKKREPILTCSYCLEKIRGLPYGHMDN